MIKELTLRNWKSFDEEAGGKLFLDPLTILIGTNASGKSNVLDALLFLQLLVSGKTLDQVLESGEIRGGAEWLIAKGKTWASLSVLVGDDSSETDYRYTVTLSSTDKNRLEITEECLERVQVRKRSSPISKNLFIAKKTVGQPGITAHFHTQSQGRGKRIDLREGLTVLFQINSLNLLKGVHDGAEQVVQDIQKIFVLDPIPSLMRDYTPLAERLQRNASNLAGVLAALPNDKKTDFEQLLTHYVKQLPENDIQKVWTELVGRFETDAMLYCAEAFGGRSLEVDARGMSDGTLRFLAIMTALLTMPEGSLLVVEEIDSGFHPSRVQVLVQFLKEEGAKRNVDVLCTTHNPALLDALGNEMIVFMSMVYRDDTSGHSHIKLLEEVDELPRLMAQGTVGKLTTLGLLEEYT